MVTLEDSSGCHQWEGCYQHQMDRTYRGCLYTVWATTQYTSNARKGLSGPNTNSAALEKSWSTWSLRQTYHLIHGVAGVIALWMCASNPHRFKQLLLLLLISVRRRLLGLFFFDGSVVLLFDRALAVTPSVFFLLPASSLLLPAWRTTSKWGRGVVIKNNQNYLVHSPSARKYHANTPHQLSLDQWMPKHQLPSLFV